MVYEAQDTRLPRSVALKVLKPGLVGDVTAARRFRREANLAASLNHPHICTILDVDEVDGQTIVAMELLRGRSLRQRLAEGPLPLEDIVKVGIRVSNALAFAHERGIVHRDVTPANILLTDNGLVKVLDFGLARRLHPSEDGSTTETQLTADSRVPGTAPYMAPELFTAPLTADHRCDLYALGTVLYEMATGAKPFDASSRLDLIALILDEPHIPVRRLAPQQPSGLAVIIDRLLAKRPADRFESGREVQAALEALLDVVAPPPAPVVTQASEPKHIAVMPFTLAPPDDEELGDLAEGLTEDLRSCLSGVPQLRVVPRTLTLQSAALSTREAAERLNVQLIASGHIERADDQLRAEVTLTDARQNSVWPVMAAHAPVADTFAAQDQIAQRLTELIVGHVTSRVARPSRARPGTDHGDALSALKRGQHHWQDRFFGGWLPAVEQFERAVTIDPGYAHAHVALAGAYEFLGSFCVMKPKLAYDVARQSVMQALELDDRLASAHLQLGLIELGGKWDWEASEAAFRRALELEPNNATCHVCYSWLLTLLGRDVAAFDEAQIAHTLAPRSRFVISGRAMTLYLARHYDDAVALCTECLRADATYIPATTIRGQCYELQGKVSEAVADLEHNVTLTNQMPYFLGLLGHCYGLAGMRTKAMALLTLLDQQARERYVPPQCYVFIHAGLGSREQALEFQERAYEDGASPFNYLAPYIRPLYALDPRHKERLAQMRLTI